MRVAVVGGGLFGCTAAAMAVKAGHDVHLFEAKRRLMGGATSACFYRLHRGYHYPRSPETGRESLAAEASFREWYGPSIMEGGQQFYVIGDESRVSPSQFVRFMRDMRLSYVWHVDHPLISNGEIFSVEEPRIDAAMLGIMAENHAALAVGPDGQRAKIDTDTEVTGRLPGFDRIIVASYAGTNRVLEALGYQPTEYKFQVVEKPIVCLPKTFRGVSIVVMDVCCIDPHQYTECHAIGHVTETIHSENVGIYPEVPTYLAGLIERGMTRHYEDDGIVRSRIRDVIRSTGEYVPATRPVEYVGSMYTVRAVLAGQEKTDARPTLVERLDDRVIRIFSGKLGTAVEAAKQAVGMLRKHQMQEVA